MNMKPEESNKKYEVKISNLPNSQVEIECEISWEYLQSFENDVVKKLSSEVEIKGFRKGSVPENIARKQIPDELIMSEMSEKAINTIYPEIITEHKIDAIGRPEVLIKKIAKNNPLVFSIKVSAVPKIDLPDYKKIASSIALSDPKEVTETEIDKVIEDLRQVRAYGHIHGESDNHEHSETLPEVNDDFAKSFGNFENVAQLRDKIKENLAKEALQATHDKRRLAIMDAIIEKTKFDLPEVLVSSETEKMIAQIESDVARSGATLEDYLKHVNKTKEELQNEFRPEAEKRSRYQILLNAIAKKSDLFPSDKEVEAEAEKYLETYPTANIEQIRAYVDMMLTNEKALKHLEE